MSRPRPPDIDSLIATRVGRGDLAGTVLGLALGGVGGVNLLVGDAVSGLMPVAAPSDARAMWAYGVGGALVMLGAWLASWKGRALAPLSACK